MNESSEIPSFAAPRLSLLIVDGDLSERIALVELVEAEGFRALEAGTLEEARKSLAQSFVDAVLLDPALPDGDGLVLIDDPSAVGRPEYVVLARDASAPTAEAARQHGAHDHLTKPVDADRLRSVLIQIARQRALRSTVPGLRIAGHEVNRFGALNGRCEQMRAIYGLIQRVAQSNASVFVTGESGTGKELVAETIHALSRRCEGPFLAVNCGAFAPTLIESELFGHEKGSFTGADRRRVGFFERANGGTLFLDEITEMPLDLQVKLLRVLETGMITRVGASEPIPVDVRILAASNRDPLEAVSGGTLRADLYYRLYVFPIELPPLRQRGGDIGLLAQLFLDQRNARDGTTKRFTPGALGCMKSYPWPGNVRELRNAVERAVILADELIDSRDLPALRTDRGLGPDGGSVLQVKAGTSIAEVVRRLILATLEGFDGDKARTAAALGISLKTLYNRLNTYEGASIKDRSAQRRRSCVLTPLSSRATGS